MKIIAFTLQITDISVNVHSTHLQQTKSKKLINVTAR